MNKKALRIRIYATSDLSDFNNLSASKLILEKTGVHMDCLPACLELCPDGGVVVSDIVELPTVSGS